MGWLRLPCRFFLMATFAEQQESDEAVFFNTDEFGETCTYTPLGGDARDVIVTLDEDGESNEGIRGLSDNASLLVLVRKSATTGIDNPRKGDTLTLQRDDDTRTFSYQGPEGGPTEGARRSLWILRFGRTLPFELGGNRR